MIWPKFRQNNQFRPKISPVFRFRPKFWLNNLFRHSRGRSQISILGFWLNRKLNQILVFGFGSGCFKSNFVCSLSTLTFVEREYSRSPIVCLSVCLDVPNFGLVELFPKMHYEHNICVLGIIG